MVGIMGGTFDPVHYGHLRLAEHIREEFGLEGILFMPAGSPPHKRGTGILPARHRLEMTRLAIAGNPAFRLHRHEIVKKGYSYTVETLEALRGEGLGDLALIIGADSLLQMGQWYQPGGILERAVILVAPRPGSDRAEIDAAIQDLTARYGGDIRVSGATAMPHSSTEIRERIAAGKSIRYLVPEPVREYIEANGLYRGVAENRIPRAGRRKRAGQEG